MLKPGKKIRQDTRTYEVCRTIGQGGSGVVYEVEQGGRRFALKLFFPFYQLPLFQEHTTEAGVAIRESIDFQSREHKFLSTLDHPNIVKVYDAGSLRLTQLEQRQVPVRGVVSLPFLVTDLVHGKPLKDALEAGMTVDRFVFVLRRLAAALEYLHAERKYMHVDIKSGNILVRSADCEPILIDFALCKNLNFAEVSQDEQTKLLGDWDLFPKELTTDHRLKVIRESGGTRKELLQLAFPYLDLFQVGKLIRSLDPLTTRLLEERDVAYLRVIADQLTDWDVVSKWGPRDLAPKLERLGPLHFAPFGVSELVAPTAAERTIMIPPGIAVPVTKLVDRILNTRSFRRLSHINQLCMLSFIYPGADYKRSVHVLHAYELARQFTIHLYASPVFRMLFDPTSARQLLVVSLLHDINHFPFLHIFQESSIPGLNRLDIVDLFCQGEATGEKDAKEPSLYDLLADVGIDPPRFKRLVFGAHHEQQGPQLEVDQVISSLLNSGVDIDKLSYLRLDAFFTGIGYGAGIDFPAILKAALIARLDKRPERPLHVAYDERAIQALESVVMTRFWNFRALYWHHTNRALMAMLLHVVRKLYVEQGRNVHDYLLDTLWSNDTEAVRYLDRRYQSQFGPSLLAGLMEDRRRLFRRIYTVQAGMGDAVDDAIHVKLKKLEYRSELRFRRALATGLAQLIRPTTGSVAISEDDVLLDVPRREMDSGGNVYVATVGAGLELLTSISDPVRAISANYERLTKRCRVFVAPAAAAQLPREWRLHNRKEIQSCVREALELSYIDSQVQ